MIEPVSNHPHLKTMLLSRYIGFHKSLLNSYKFSLRFVARLCEQDLRTVLGETLNEIRKLCGVSLPEITKQTVKKKVKYSSFDEDNIWRAELPTELSSWRRNQLEVPGFSPSQMEDIFKYICTS